MSPERIIAETRTLNQDEKNLAANMKLAAIALKETMKKDTELSRLFKEEVHGLYEKSNWKEAFSFNQLLDAQEPVYKSSETSKGKGVNPILCEKFSAKFIKNLKQENTKLKSTNTINLDGLQVYYPYSEEFIAVASPNYTYTYASLSNDAENYGWVYDSATDNDIQVIVDDNYAYTHPTLIIMPEGTADATSVAPGDPAVISSPFNGGEGRQIFIGEMMSTKQYGELFTGGPNFTFVFVKPGDAIASFTTNDQVFSGKNVVPGLSFSRKQVRNQEWKTFIKPACPDWISKYEICHWGIFEDDSQNWFANSKITFKPEIKYKDFSLSVWNIEFTNNGNDHVGEISWDRNSYLALNNSICTEGYNGIPYWETKTYFGKTYRIYQLGAVSFTLPYVEFVQGNSN